jgi:hypothetical protein
LPGVSHLPGCAIKGRGLCPEYREKPPAAELATGIAQSTQGGKVMYL